MNYIYWLSQIQYSEQFLVGDKLFILSQLLQHECPVLPGFVLGNNLLRQFLADLKAELSAVNADNQWQKLAINDYQTLQSVASRSRQIVNQALFNQTWEVEIERAVQQLNSERLILEPFITTPDGQHCSISSLWRSHTCNHTPEALSTAIKLVWSELFTASSLLYWQKLGLTSEQVNLSILVRPLKAAYASGMVKVSSEGIEIKASWGLEQSLLQGDTEPDRYYVDLHTGYILSQHLGQKNYAYRPKSVDLNQPSIDCVEAYIPEEDLAETYVLDSKAIALLLQLTQNVLEKQPPIKYLAWTAFKSQFTFTPHFYFTRFSDYLISAAPAAEHNTALTPSLPVQPLLTGVAVSSGKVQSEVVVVKDFDTHHQPIPTGSILVTKIINPQHISLIKQVGGIITEIGGKTSHGAIIARELNIPAVVNVTNATEILQNTATVLLNGDDGKVYPAQKHPQLSSRLSFNRPMFSSAYPIATKLMVNLSQPESIASASNLPIDGVGLLRSELMLAELLASPTFAQWQKSFQKELVTTLTNSLRQFTAAFTPRPVFYRSLDRYAEDSLNPVSKSRGTYGYLSDPTLFDLELEALKIITAEGYANLNLILPFVRSVEEFKFCDRRIENIGLTAQNSFQVWIMAEVPSVLMLLPEYARAGVKGIAIGTNDLTQLLLGVDREQSQFSDRGLNANHPAMQKAIAKIIKTAKAHNMECCICGQAPVEHPSLIDKLIQWGIDTISVEPEAVGRTYGAIARAEQRILLDRVRSKE
ncbi:MAG: putative PEP-binding protein [Pleurocapsa sp.]